MTRVCSRCKESKPIADFRLDKRKPFGCGYQCRPCFTTAVEPSSRAYVERNRERVKARYRARDARYRKTGVLLPPRDPKKLRARAAARNAAAAGRLVKPKNCDACGTVARLHAHHDDYDKPLDVRWLCSICHGLVHRTALLTARGPGQ